MEDWWAVVDGLGFEPARTLLHYLDPLPETEATVARFFAELRRGLPAGVWFPLRERLDRLPLAMLLQNIGELRDARHLLTPDDLRHAEERLALADAEPVVLWEKLIAHAAECEGEDAGGQDRRLVARLTEALARHPEFSTPRTLEILRDASIEDWREIFAIELAGALRCGEAIDPLIGKLRIDTDYMLERARAALVRIGDAGIPARIAADWENEEWNFRNYAHGVIASFRTRENAAILRGLIAREPDAEEQVMMTVSLLEMLPDDAETLESVRQFILAVPEDAALEHADLLLATVATMTGWDFPEHAEWRAAALAEEKRVLAFLDRDPEQDEKVRAGMIAGLSLKDAGGRMFGGEFDDLENWDEEEESFALPFVRDEPKVGRNDPCPCNSGKKYKKCCGGAA